MNTEQFHSIMVFPEKSISQISLGKLKADLEKVSFQTLCRQYGLDSGLIDQTMRNLQVVFSDIDVSSYLVVSYLPPGGRPLIVYRWQIPSEDGNRILAAIKETISDKALAERLLASREVYSIVLQPSQLEDLGLLLGYEIARWVGFHGDGLVRDLYGEWYVLNRHQAFIPVWEKGKI